MWHIDRWGKIVDENGDDVMMRSVSNLCSGSNEAVAKAEKNTILAASAPQLLEALERIIYIGISDETLLQARAAIAAAKGEKG